MESSEYALITFWIYTGMFTVFSLVSFVLGYNVGKDLENAKKKEKRQ